MWQNTDDRTDAEYDEWLAEVGSAEAEQDMEPHKRADYFEMMCDMADHQRKWIEGEREMSANPETMCWRCNKVFGADKLNCPRCAATNKLVDFATAFHEVASEMGNPDRSR